MASPFTKPSKVKKILNFLRIILLSKIPMNLLFLIIIIMISIIGFQNLKGKGTTGAAVIEEKENAECPECICEEKKCEINCSLCPIKTKIEKVNVIYYRCEDGSLVRDLEECKPKFPEIDEKYSGTVSGVTLSIDDIKLEKEDEDSGFVTEISYTIINKGDLPIVPKIEIKVYREWSYKVKASEPNKVIDTESVVAPNDFIKRTDKVRIYFKGKEQTIRLLLIDMLPDPDREILAVTRDFILE